MTNITKEVVYKGDDKDYIPSILSRDGKKVNCVKDTEWDYHWGIELKQCMLDSCEVYVKEVQTYETGKIFNEFVDHFYKEKANAKKEDNKSKYQFNKNILTNLYGKFSTKSLTNTKLINGYTELYDAVDGDIHNLVNQTEHNTDDDMSIVEVKNAEEKYNNNIGTLTRLSSYISAKTRVSMAKMMREIGHKHIYYCATDSIYTDKKIDDKYIDEFKLGYWDLESTIDDARFIGCGSYYYNDITKGFSNKCKAFNKEDVSREDYISLSNGEMEYVSKTKIINFRDHEKVHVENQGRRLKSNLNKRIFTKDNRSIAYKNIEEWKSKS